jgi:transposase InsO family protein
VIWAKTRFWTRRDGWCWFFGAIDHCVEDVVGWHVAKVGDRWAALEPIRQGVQRTHGAYVPKIALGLGLRMDWGPQYTAHQFLGELRWLGIRPSPSYVGEPECNGIMERWIRTLKEECLYLHDFATLESSSLVMGLNILLNSLPPPKTPMPEGAMAFAGALMKTGYLLPLLGATQAVVGVLLLANRFVPLALIAPVVVNIVAFHIFLRAPGLGLAALVLVLEVYLAWAYRQAYRGMLAMRATPGAR